MKDDNHKQPGRDDSIRIAMWSGPRNISTTLMRAWGSRADTLVCDEPLYAHYLLATGAPHPGREEVIAAHETDWRRVADWLTGPVPEGRSVFYQKHMAKHLLSDIDRGWLDALTHAFLIRDPADMLASYSRVMPDPDIGDTGLPVQWELFERAAQRTGVAPPVIDCDDVLSDPRGVLRRLCAALGVAFDEAMLEWPAGRRETDGVWAPHWYAAVEASTGFGPPRRQRAQLDDPALQVLSDRCRPWYERLAAFRITP
ncbi:MAG: branched-chain amino acid aminotransferase [Gammaproteobacteria bacterium SG8_30]|nr:MAG: branched-chain amino acid aminotransferase [Gammaproteobacteria bacterium SG8_30]